MDIDSMPAGVELDALVAEKVMGEQICEHSRKGSVAQSSGWAMCMKCAPGGDLKYHYHFLPHYSVYIADAHKVVEAITKRFPAKDSGMPTIMLVYRGYRDPEWIVKCQHRVNGMWHDEWTEGKAETVPLAICRAALKAVEWE